MEETEGQDQENSQASAPEPKGPETIRRIDEGQVSEEQSDTTEDETEETSAQTYRLIDKDLTADELYDYAKTQQGYVSQLEADKKKWEESAQKEVTQSIAENPYLRELDPNVKTAIEEITRPLIEDSLKRRDAEEQKKAQEQDFARQVDDLKTKYPGGDGKPKFDEMRVLSAMQAKDNPGIYDPEQMYWHLNRQALIDYEIKQAMKGKQSDTKTEDTGSSQPRKPEKGSPKSWDEATRRATSRV
jgi:hypothetical protein